MRNAFHMCARSASSVSLIGLLCRQKHSRRCMFVAAAARLAKAFNLCSHNTGGVICI